MDHRALERHRRRNRLQSVAVVAGICAWVALVGWLVAGEIGLAWAALGTGLSLLVQPARSTLVLKALYGARPIAPAAAPQLHAMVAELSRRAHLEIVPPLLLIPRAELVALSTGWGRDAALAVSAGLLNLLPGRELAGVLAHEISHVSHGDLKMLRLAEAAGQLTRILSLFGVLLMLLSQAAGMGVPLLPLVLVVAAPLVSDLMMLKLSRTREFDADAGAAALTGDPGALADSLRRLALLQDGGWENLRRGRLPRWLGLIRTHPGNDERIARLRELEPDAGATWISLLHPLVLPALMNARRRPF